MKIWSYLKKIVTNPVLWLVLAALVYMSPMLVYPNFHYVDDGLNLQTASTVLASHNVSVWQKNLFELSAGRLRPGYQLYFMVLFFLFGAQPFAYWFFQTTVVALTLIGLRTLIKTVAPVKEWVSTLVPIGFLLLPAVIENTYRLGTSEPRQALFIIWFLVWLSRLNVKKLKLRDFFTGNVLLFLALITKETSLILLPITLVFFGWQWLRGLIKQKMPWYLLLSLVVQVVIFFLLLPKRQAYTTNVNFSLQQLWYGVLVARFDYAEYYFPMVVAVIFTFFRGLKSLQKHTLLSYLKSLQWPVVFFTGFITSLLFVFSWEHQLERYHYLSFIFVILFVFAEARFHQISVKALKKISRKALLQFVPTLIVLIVAGILMFQNRYLYRKNVIARSVEAWQKMFYPQQAAGQLTSYLFHSLPPGTKVFLDTKEYETVMGVGYFATQLGQRNALVYSANEYAFQNDPQVQRYSQDIFTDYKKATAPKLLVVADEHRFNFARDELKLLSPPFVIDYSRFVYFFWRIKTSF